MNPLFIGPNERARLAALRELANDMPVDMVQLMERIKTPEGKAAHSQQMTRQTVVLPASYMVTFSIELNHPIGPARHMSMSTTRDGFIPNNASVWTVAELLGFTDGLDSCTQWVEQLQGHGKAVNVVQPILSEASKT